MKAKKFYKDIYQDIKKKVALFAELHGQSEVISKQLQIDDDPESSKLITDENEALEEASMRG